MRRTTRSAWFLGLTVGVGGLAFQGCSDLPPIGATPDSGGHTQAKVPATMPSSAKAHSGAHSQETDAAEAAKQQADRLNRAMSAKDEAAPTAVPPDGIPEIRWIDPSADARQKRTALASGNSPASIDADIAATGGAGTTQPSDRNHRAHAGAAALANAPGQYPRADRHALVARLLDEIRAGKDPAMAKAVAAAGLSLSDPGRGLDGADLDGLTDPQRQQVRRYFDLINSLGRQLDAGGKLPDAASLADQVEGLGGNLPVRVRSVHLCRRVSGYGVYDAFEPNTFVAGHEQPVIVYVELDQFRAAKGADDLFHVKLAQEVTLYNESDGLAVWRQPSVEIVDDSHNRRRDFFLVQLVRLPANLGVGKFRLNVRVTDMADSSLDEFKVPIQIVADASLVSSKTTP